MGRMRNYQRVCIGISHTAAISLAMFFLITASSAQTFPRFDDYPMTVYSGKIHPPTWIRRVADGEWKDNLGKLVGPPEVNFAGKYFIALHSCGTGCRYYTLTDLSSGRSLDVLRGFDAGEAAPKTRDGHPYTTSLVTRANSKLLVAQYQVDLDGGEECRERAFVFDGDRIKPISKTRRACTRY